MLHEFGHALGLIHEHQNPAAAIPWNRAAVYDYYADRLTTGRRTGWNSTSSKPMTRQAPNIRRLTPIQSCSTPSPEFTEGGFSVGWNQTLSETDKAFIAACYPFPHTPASTSDSAQPAALAAPAPSVAERFIIPVLRTQPFTDTHQAPPNTQRLHWNESPYDFPAALKAEVLRRLEGAKWSEYPPKMRPFDLSAGLAAKYKVAPESVVVSNGSSDVLRIVMTSVLQRDDQMVTVTPTFYAYKLWGERLGATVHEIALAPDDGFALPVDALLHQVHATNAKLILLATPNNPTGKAYPLAALQQLVQGCEALLVIDEAYAEFCNQDLRPLLELSDRVVLLRTFSKAFSMAGVRLGYALCAPALGVELQKATTVFTLNLFAETVATVALENEAYFQAGVARIVAAREAFAQALATLPCVTLFPSDANFLLIRLDRPARPVAQQLMTQDRLLVGALGDPGLEHYLRISVGTASQNEALVAALRSYL
ncbi:MAG: aminotransferase class I/II-fold pyridoxal phosphate-dependent enzyme [Caldilineaceae bacterium]